MPGGLISIHGAILLFGTAGLFGKFLSFDAVLIVLGRTLIAFLALVLVHLLMRVPVLLKEQKSWIWLAMTGGILAVHWIGFFRSIQVSSVAIGLLSFSSYPLFTTFLEPMFFPERLKRKNIFAVIANRELRLRRLRRNRNAAGTALQKRSKVFRNLFLFYLLSCLYYVLILLGVSGGLGRLFSPKTRSVIK